MIKNFLIWFDFNLLLELETSFEPTLITLILNLSKQRGDHFKSYKSGLLSRKAIRRLYKETMPCPETIKCTRWVFPNLNGFFFKFSIRFVKFSCVFIIMRIVEVPRQTLHNFISLETRTKNRAWSKPGLTSLFYFFTT